MTAAPSLLPPNATPLERALEMLAALRLGKIDTPFRELWNAQTCPEELLPYLAWGLSVDQWSADWPLYIRRARVASAIEIQRRNPMLIQPMGRNLHGHSPRPGLLQLRQHGLYRQRIRRGMPPGLQRTMEAATQCANDAAVLAQTIQRLRQQLRDTGLAVGAGHADQIHGPTWLAVKASCNR